MFRLGEGEPVLDWGGGIKPPAQDKNREDDDCQGRAWNLEFGIRNLEFGIRNLGCVAEIANPRTRSIKNAWKNRPTYWHLMCWAESMRVMHPTYEGGQDIRDRTFEFACNVVELCEELYTRGGVGRLLVPQIVNCSTSCAAMLEEARAAESTRDFIWKCAIGLKDARESHVRLKILKTKRARAQERFGARLPNSKFLIPNSKLLE